MHHSIPTFHDNLGFFISLISTTGNLLETPKQQLAERQNTLIPDHRFVIKLQDI